jgi:hypothetical protein
MSMEGINWGQVNSEAQKVVNNFNELSKTLRDRLHDFEGQLCTIWASGNAVKFGDDSNNAILGLCSYINTGLSEIIDAISKAAATYASAFNVDNEFSVNVGFSGEANLENVFKEVVNGITGMNKTDVQDCLSHFTKDTATAIETFNNNLKSVNLGIYDSAGAQQASFEGCLQSMMTNISNELQKLVDEINAGIETEIDNVALVKTQTVNTFRSE